MVHLDHLGHGLFEIFYSIWEEHEKNKHAITPPHKEEKGFIWVSQEMHEAASTIINSVINSIDKGIPISYHLYFNHAQLIKTMLTKCNRLDLIPEPPNNFTGKVYTEFEDIDPQS